MHPIYARLWLGDQAYIQWMNRLIITCQGMVNKAAPWCESCAIIECRSHCQLVSTMW